MVIKKAEIIAFLSLYFFTIIVMYFTPRSAHLLYCMALLGYYIQTKNDPFWFAFLFVIIDPPGMLFNAGDMGHNFRVITLGSRWIEFSELFYLAVIFKAIIKKPRKLQYFYFNALLPILFFTFILFVYGMSDGMDFSKMLRAMRLIFPFLMFFYIPRFLQEAEKYRAFFILLSVFTIFVLLIQIFELVSGRVLAGYLGGTVDIDMQTQGELAARQVYSVFIILTNIYGILHFKSLKQNILPGVWNNISLIAGVLSLTLNATRGYWIGMIIMIAGYVISSQKKNLLSLIQLVGLLLLFLLIFVQIPQFSYQLSKATSRLETLSDLTEGDMTAGGTLGRITERAPIVLNKFAERPLIGWGFSNTYFEYADGHVAHPTLLLGGGIIGYLIWLYFWLYYLFYNVNTYFRLSPSNPYRSSILVNILGFIAFLVVGSTSTTVFTYLIGDNAFFLAIIFGLAGLNIKKAFQLRIRNRLNRIKVNNIT